MVGPRSEHAHSIPISRMVAFCESHSPFHVCLTICPSTHLVYITSHLSFVAFYSYLVSCIICACSIHGQPRYQIWIKSNKRQMTSCVHKMWEQTYGQTNMKRATTLAKINLMFVWSYVRPHILCTQLVICLVAFYSYLVSWLAMIWACA
jgi:hypothetical protein